MWYVQTKCIQTSHSSSEANALILIFNTMFSVKVIGLKDQFLLNVFSSLAVCDYLKDKTHARINVKWPNDVLVEDKKISGILIENQLQGNTISSSVVGVGINVMQEVFSIKDATSLRTITGQSYELAEEFDRIISCIEARYLQLKNPSFRFA